MFSVLSIVAIFYVVVLLVVEFPGYYIEMTTREEPKSIIWFYFDDAILDSVAITFFAYTCHASLFPIYSELSAPNRKRMNKVIKRSILVDALFYLVVAIPGYLSTFDDTPPLVVNRAPLSGERDIFMMIARIAIWISMIFGFPVNYNPFRNNLFHFMKGTTEFTNRENFIMTTITVALATTLAILFPNITSVISILGGFFSVIICYLTPLII